MNITIEKKIVSDLKNWFISYVNKFKYYNNESQQNINIKIDHSVRVAAEIINIGKQLGLNDNELSLAEIIALFHDIGRFEQYDRYKTFSDYKSVNHAELGIKILKENNILGNLHKQAQKLIICSIKYHNKPSLPVKESKTCLFYSSLIRDADKLDILNLVTDYYHRKNDRRNIAIELELPETPGISAEIYKTLMNRHVVDVKYVNNINDIKLLQAGWIYDINFKPTFEYIKNRRYLELLKEVLPKTREVTNVFDTIKSYIEDRERENSPVNGRL